MSRARSLLLLPALWLATGCYTTTLRSGLQPAPAGPTVEYDEKWHSGIVVGIAELSGPHKLTEICPHGWAEIVTETSFVNGVVEAVTMGVYNPQTVTVVCAAGPMPMPMSPATAPPPPTGAPPPGTAPPPPPAAPPPGTAPPLPGAAPPPPPPPPPPPSTGVMPPAGG